MTHPFVLPPGFRFGVATAGFQVEGGYNGPGEPRNNWFRWEAEGRVEPSGTAVDFWQRYEDHLDLAVDAGCDAFRLSVEWARCEPADGELDDTAFDRYRAILAACHERGLQPLVTLHHFTHPHWLGEAFWTQLDAPERYAAWVREAAGRLHDRCGAWVTINELNVLALQTHLTGLFPPGRHLSVGDVVRTLDHLLAGHVLAYGVIRSLQPGAVVSTNTYSFSVYELDRLLTDVLVARRHGIGRHDLRPWLLERREELDAAVAPWSGRERVVKLWARAAIPLEQALPRAVDEVYRCDHACTLDVTQVDHSDPTASHHVRVPGHRTAGGRSWQAGRMPWDDRPDPAGFRRHTGLHVEPGLPVWVVENGLCNRVRNGRSYQRLDGYDRPRYLREHLAEVVAMVDAGVPLAGYYHRCLADSYEWGSYEPRFGLYGVDRARGARIGTLDAMGRDSAGTYRRIVSALRAGERAPAGVAR